MARTIELLARACDADYHQQVLDEAAGPGYCGAVAAALEAKGRSGADLADELLERRAGRWPLLRLVYWPLGWLSRMVGRHALAGRPLATVQAGEPTDVDGSTLLDRIELIRSRIEADHAVVTQRLRLTSELPTVATLARRAGLAIQSIVGQLDDRLLGAIETQDRRPSWLARAGLWFILLWFPLLQPISATALEMIGADGAFDVSLALVKLVRALSAGHLLLAIIAPTAIFVAILAGMYARAHRDVRRARDTLAEDAPIAEAVDEVLVTQIVGPLTAPHRDRLDHLVNLQDRLTKVAPAG